ncbi:MAG: 3-oxoacyl-[acyl-carrier-protein] reductase [Chloroflexi bacterium]|nr:3-oxoacyl-[acyl-carrier-protein] reductase [Chloroflexota bacterium]
MSNDNEFASYVALVTGASRGIGRAVAVRLASGGATVGVSYLSNTKAAEETVHTIEAAGGKAVLLQGDVGAPGVADRLVRELLALFNRIDVLVNNAGITRDNLVMRMDDASWDAVLTTNLKSAFLCSKAVVRPMLRTGGRIINISSVSGVMGNAGQANYSAAKAGMIGLTMALARELASRNITVNAVAPGFITTAMTAQLKEEQVAHLRQFIPLNRFGSVEDVAEAVAFLASSRASYITGQVLRVDGGMVMG